MCSIVGSTNYKPEKIKHSDSKSRQEFIMDCVFVNVGTSVLYVALHEDVSGDIRALHKNKDRKVISKMKDTYEKLESKRRLIFHSLDQRDLKTIKTKTDDSSVAFINYISTTDKILSLEHLAVAFIDAGLNRKRKRDMNSIFEYFLDFKLLYENISSNLELKGIRPKHEFDLANLFVSKVRY